MKEFPFDPYDFFGYLASGYIIVAGLELVVGVPNVLGNDLKSFELIILTLGAYVLGQIAATPAQFILEITIVNRILKPPSEALMNDANSKYLKYIIPGYYAALPSDIREKIQTKAKSEGCSECKGENLFLHIRFKDNMRTDEDLMKRLGTFLNKYGFNRNLSFTCIFFGLVVLVLEGTDPVIETVKYAYISLAVGFFLFLRYLKFYRQYTYELFNTYAGKA